jgi:hypothetical protein
MNTEEEKLDHIINILTALRDGKIVQVRNSQDSPKWFDRCFPGTTTIAQACFESIASEPEFYRVKPEPREWWDIVLEAENRVLARHESYEDVMYHWTKGYNDTERSVRKIIHVREVI